MRFEVDRDVIGLFIWRLRASNGLILANGEAYVNKSGSMHAIELVKAAAIEQYSVYLDIASQWRWTLRARNGEIIAKSSEGYYNRADCENAARSTWSANAATPVWDLTVAATGRR